MTQVITLLIVGPPIAACGWWLFSRSWAKMVEGGSVSKRTAKRQKYEFFAVMILCFIAMLITDIKMHKL